MTEDEHLLSCLAEECAEVAHRVSKALRFGLTEVQPGQDLTNAQRIAEELIDLRAVEEMLIKKCVLPPRLRFGEEGEALDRKREKVERFIIYARGRGTVRLEDDR